MKIACLCIGFFISCFLYAQPKTISSDKDWTAQQAVLKNSIEAEYIIRTGDVDNLGFGWPDGFDPFCGRMAEAHPYPWEAKEADRPGFDRILLSSKYDPSKEHSCGGDGYSGAYDGDKTKPKTWSLNTDELKGVMIQNAWVQIFIDDFQAPSLCSKFQLFVNGKRFVEGEKIINAIDQTGPVGKLISLPLTEDFYPVINSGKPLTL